jgi:hypothetical protein
MPKMKNNTKLSLLALLLLSNLMTFAQPGNDQGGGGLEGNDPPPASIDSLIVVIAIIGTLFVFNLYKQQNKKA